MSKRNITFSKPAEPAFLRRIKEQVGYKEGPTVDTKREELAAARPEDFADTEEEQPTVVVLQPGDLTAEEADEHHRRILKEEDEKPADLAAPIVFKAPSKKKLEVGAESPAKKKPRIESGNSKKQRNKALLSFDEDEEDSSP